MKNGSLPLSVIMLTHRSDDRFRQAVASAQPAEEVLIVDYQSGNDWQQLKKQFHFRTIARRTMIRNFSAERNSALKKAKHDWVLFLDSDETIQPESWKAIAAVITTPNTSGALVRRRDIFYGKVLKHGETGQVWLPRLMKKEAGTFSRPVHETALIQGKILKTDIVFYHFAHTSITEFLHDIAQYAAIEAEYQSDKKLPVFWLAVKTVLYPKLKFFQNYVLRLGFLDGWRGLVYALMMSFHSLFVRVFSYENR